MSEEYHPGTPDSPARGSMSGSPPAPPGAGSSQMVSVNAGEPAAGDWFTRLLIPAYESKGWLKFLGVVMIISGGLTALTIVGLIFAWLYIWVGVLLWQAGDRANSAYLSRDHAMLTQYMQKLKTIIVIAGVLTAIGLVAAVLSLILGLSMGWMAMVAEQMGR